MRLRVPMAHSAMHRLRSMASECHSMRGVAVGFGRLTFQAHLPLCRLRRL
jgi:hypothetical protein